MSTRKGPPKHQNKFAWKWDAGCKKNETELGGKFRPFSDVTGVCGRCKDQIEWKRKYGKYKPLTEPAKCAHCGKRAVRQAYHMLCSACAKERGVCAKCSHVVDAIIGRDAEEVEVERKQLEEAIKNSRERDRRTLLRAMNKNQQEGMHKTLKSLKNKAESELESDQSELALDDNDSTEHSSEDDTSDNGQGIIESGGRFEGKDLK
ncbi:uncharacterized protein LOC131034101 [Cryptomeria japonica]|uniref:uncharacterized protein LOC131034101 n=1 Tax=Cryptomeria japonica TaxID=3369 RepID=UPI0027DA8A1B|nr:uncharacterized protein LOC131034101 [Cryptomeria japonica]